ncbi:MAG: restriction endonuclease subunit R, partial [Planctomycetes bacterium]|nr:restriction endonuclease subunit R [Planctomycetota bacterium]
MSPTTEAQPSHAMSPADKVRLFGSLFRGRPDVYPKLWINSKKGTKGYSPACTNEWVRGVCEKPRVKCGECPRQAFQPIDDDTILGHLQGRHVIGVYPMLFDESCWFLAADFDKGNWMEDVASFVATCRGHDVPVAVERSRSGNGAHVWFFFAAPVPAAIARTMGCFLLTETMSRHHELPLSSYDRLFPNQDTMPRGGFGNLIALPLQRSARQAGHTLFVDEAWQPLPDQWAFLAGAPRIEPRRVHELAQEARDGGRIIGARNADSATEDDAEPWRRRPSRRTTRPTITAPLPAQVRAVLSQQLFVEQQGLPSALISEIKRLAAFQNPEFYKKQAMRLSTALTPRVISCGENTPQHVGLPRGCVEDLRELLAAYDVGLSVDDQRDLGTPLDLTFEGQLEPAQQDAAQD